MATLWVYLRIQLMTAVSGIVGPIFLFIYFSVQPDPTVRWMYWWGLLITVGDVLVALALTDTVTRRDRELAAERDRRVAQDQSP